MPTETAAVLRHVLDRLRARDPEYDALRRALRAAIVLPIAAAVSFAVGGGSQTPLFTIFGSVALLIMVDFPATGLRARWRIAASGSTAPSSSRWARWSHRIRG